jgi:beta-lactamase family protein
VVRFLAMAALAVAAATATPATASAEDEPPGLPRTDPRTLIELPFPELRTPSEIAPPGSRAEAPLGVYPALAPARRLVFPSDAALAAAARYAEAREGRVSFAVLAAQGALSGIDAERPYESASLVKAMILVAYLRKLAAEGREPSDLETQRMDEMIRVSDNVSATDLYGDLGPEALEQVASDAGMRGFASNAFWGNSQVTAADQARFFIALDRLLPAAHREYGLGLLANVAPFHSWGIPEAARPAWRVFFKGGWRPDDDEGEIVHQGALLERGAQRVAIAVLTDLNPSETYGHETIRGVAQRLLQTSGGRPPGVAPGLLAPLTALRGYRVPEPKPLRPIPTAYARASGK